MCNHLDEIKSAMIAAGIRILHIGQPWSKNCREWVMFDCWIDNDAIRKRFTLADCIEDHDHLGTHDGCESGLVCASCHDALIGIHKINMKPTTAIFK
jgi:hypothetical protein